MSRILSFRPHIENLTREYCEDLFPDSQRSSPLSEAMSSILGEAVVGLSSYRDEGSKNVPLLFLCTDLRESLTALKGNDPIEIGKGPLHPRTVRNLLKSCGPLGQNHEWALYLVPESEALSFGVFRTDRFPLHQASFQRLRMIKDSSIPIVGLQRIGENTVELRSSRGRSTHIDASGLLEISQNPFTAISHWVNSVTAHVPNLTRGRIQAFYHRIGVDLLSASHGSLIAVQTRGTPYPDFLRDGVILKEEFGLSQAIDRYLKNRDEATAFSLSSYSNLIRKMIGMDGITVFNTSGNVLAYNCFTPELPQRPLERAIIGGARKRAFDFLCTHLGTALCCALFHSQDGYYQCRTG